MKIAIVRTSNAPINISTYNVQEIGLAQGLLHHGVSTEIYSKYENIKTETIIEEFKNNYVKLIPIKGLSFFKQITYYPKLISKILLANYDVIQIHEDSQFMTPFILSIARKKGIKTVLYQGMYKPYNGLGAIYQRVFNFLFLNKTIKNAHICIAKTTSAENYLRKLGFSNIFVQPVGLMINANETPYAQIEDVIKFTSKFHSTLLYIGVIEPRRDLSFVIDILKNIRECKNRNIGLIILGTGPDLLKIKKYVEQHNLLDAVMFIEKIPNSQVACVYKCCNIFLLPSHYEIYGMVVLEALYNGLPVISSKTAGPIDIITKSFHGCVLEFDRNSWSDSIDFYIQSEQQSEEIKNKRKEYIMQTYSWDLIAEGYLKILKNENNFS
jgi:glycosyltransferase involved in cell wall biosynthesis